jgi:PadR family transcriptional regulator AphA
MPEANAGSRVLSLPEWIVLALIAEHPRHGFAVAALTAPDGDVGRAWQVPRPVVYRAIRELTRLGLLEVDATEHGRRGPQRSVLAATPEGASAVRRWLRTPVRHVRDVRSEVLVKLALCKRRGFSSTGLVRAQRRVLTGIEEALRLPDVGTDDEFGKLLRLWRLESARAALRFLDAI